MFAPIIATKLLFPPPRSNLVHRPRLMERLAAGLRGPLTLVSAPPGSGKTTLLSEWQAAAGADAAVAWLSLDGADNDPARFLMCLLGALLANTLGEALASAVIASLGASSFAFVVNPLEAYLLSPLLMVGSVLVATMLGTLDAGNIKVSENIKE